jgi:diacylglycerol kinase family enzyme
LFDAKAYEAIFKASGGIPRRINSHCDRLLLSGFLSGKKKKFTLADVESVAKEISEETLAPAFFNNEKASGSDLVRDGARLTDSGILDIDLSKLELAAGTADEASRAIADLKNGLNDQRIARLERSMIRIERSSAATLTLLQQLVTAVRVRQNEKENPS